MDKTDEENQVNELINKELLNTISLAKSLATTLDEQGDHITNSHQTLNQIEDDSKLSLKTVRMMDSRFYRWWIWLVDIGNTVTNNITSSFVTTQNLPSEIIQVPLNPKTIHKPNSQNEITDISHNLEILKEISLNINDELTNHCQKYEEIYKLTEKNRERLNHSSQIANKMS